MRILSEEMQHLYDWLEECKNDLKAEAEGKSFDAFMMLETQSASYAVVQKFILKNFGEGSPDEDVH